MGGRGREERRGESVRKGGKRGERGRREGGREEERKKGERKKGKKGEEIRGKGGRRGGRGKGGRRGGREERREEGREEGREGREGRREGGSQEGRDSLRPHVWMLHTVALCLTNYQYLIIGKQKEARGLFTGGSQSHQVGFEVYNEPQLPTVHHSVGVHRV